MKHPKIVASTVLAVLVAVSSFQLAPIAARAINRDFSLNWSSIYNYKGYDKSKYKSSGIYWHQELNKKSGTNINKGNQVLGYTTHYSSSDKQSYNSLVNNSALVDQIATHTYVTDSRGNIKGYPPKDQVNFANKKGITTFAMMNNNFDKNISKTLLANSSSRRNLINNLLKEIKTHNYDGVNVDIEGIYPSSRNDLTLFIKELSETLRPQGYLTAISVAAKTGDYPNDGWSGAYDYKQLGKYADQIVIMTYDLHHPYGDPGPIASIDWFRNVIKYAISVIPREKIVVGVAAYGYDWSSRPAKAYSISQAYNTAKKYNVPVQWDSKSQTPYFSYRDEKGIDHSVWFENSTSLGYKLDVVNQYKINGIAIWRMGLEDSSYWSVIKNKFKK